MVIKQEPLPAYDLAKDGNKFQWIIEQAALIRDRRLREIRQPRPQFDYLTGKSIKKTL